MATQRKQLLAAQSSWQARNRVRFAGGQGLPQGSQFVLGFAWGEDLRAGGQLESRDRSVPTRSAQARPGQPFEKLARRFDARSGVAGRFANIGLEDLSQRDDRWDDQGEGL